MVEVTGSTFINGMFLFLFLLNITWTLIFGADENVLLTISLKTYDFIADIFIVLELLQPLPPRFPPPRANLRLQEHLLSLRSLLMNVSRHLLYAQTSNGLSILPQDWLPNHVMTIQLISIIITY